MRKVRQYQVWTKVESTWETVGPVCAEREATELARVYSSNCAAIALPVGVDPTAVERGEVTRYGDAKRVAP